MPGKWIPKCLQFDKRIIRLNEISTNSLHRQLALIYQPFINGVFIEIVQTKNRIGGRKVKAENAPLMSPTRKGCLIQPKVSARNAIRSDRPIKLRLPWDQLDSQTIYLQRYFDKIDSPAIICFSTWLRTDWLPDSCGIPLSRFLKFQTKLP